jgi:hypothetical protein
MLLDDWTRTPRHEHPYRWLSTADGHLLAPEYASRLALTFPGGAFVRHDAGTRRCKSYQNFSRELVAPDGARDDRLPPLWRDLVADLLDPAYRSTVAALLGQEPAKRIEVRLVRHAPGDWLGPHTDRADKLFSHIIYFNPHWQPEWGGCLEILEGASPAAVAARVIPRLGTSALMARAENSWHQVTPVTAEAVTCADRRSMLVHGLR